MSKAHRILVAVDESEASRRALAYVGDIVGSRADTTVRLLHLLPPVPPRHLEHGGAEEPEAEERLEVGLREGRADWMAAEAAKVEPIFEGAKRVLASHGLVSARVETECRAPVGPSTVAGECLDAARESRCDTIVLARHAMPWHRELLHHHASDKVVRGGRGLAIWVVE